MISNQTLKELSTERKAILDQETESIENITFRMTKKDLFFSFFYYFTFSFAYIALASLFLSSLSQNEISFLSFYFEPDEFFNSSQMISTLLAVGIFTYSACFSFFLFIKKPRDYIEVGFIGIAYFNFSHAFAYGSMISLFSLFLWHLTVFLFTDQSIFYYILYSNLLFGSVCLAAVVALFYFFKELLKMPNKQESKEIESKETTLFLDSISLKSDFDKKCEHIFSNDITNIFEIESLRNIIENQYPEFNSLFNNRKNALANENGFDNYSDFFLNVMEKHSNKQNSILNH